MDWNAPLDLYCERLSEGLLAEPLNFITNGSFLLAAFFLWRQYQKNAHIFRRKGSLFLICNVALIGIGSSIFHSVATSWAMWADVIPIVVFLLSYITLFFLYDAGLTALQTILGLGVFAVISLMTSTLANHDLANGSEMYFGAWVSLFGVSCYLLGKPNVRQRWLVAGATISFSTSMLLRTIDMRMCESWPLGTHFAWHLLNGLTLYLVTKAYINAPSQST